MPTAQDIMTTDLTTLPTTASVEEAARCMRDEDIGNVIVIADDGAVMGLLTDRDITIRAVAEGQDPSDIQVGEICSADLVTATPDQDINDVITMMRDAAVRRIPVVEGDQAIGIISLGDLAVEREPGSVLADISVEDPDR